MHFAGKRLFARARALSVLYTVYILVPSLLSSGSGICVSNCSGVMRRCLSFFMSAISFRSCSSSCITGGGYYSASYSYSYFVC